jgi:hypothetical protein
MRSKKSFKVSVGNLGEVSVQFKILASFIEYTCSNIAHSIYSLNGEWLDSSIATGVELKEELEMLKWTSNTPISLRLFFTFAWATIIPVIVIITLSSIYFQALDAGREAVQTSNQTIKITTDELANLQSMHALLVALLPSVTANSNTDASVTKSEQDVIFQVLSIEGSFDVDTVKYQEQYQLATAPAAADIRQILTSNDPHPSIISTQRTLLDIILDHQWPLHSVASKLAAGSRHCREGEYRGCQSWPGSDQSDASRDDHRVYKFDVHCVRY